MLLLFLLGSGLVSSAAAQTLEQRVAAIELSNRTEPWQVSADLIQALEPVRSSLNDDLRFRIELVEARNHALEGDYASGLAMIESMLKRQVPPDLRIRALTLAVNMTTNVSEYPRAFAWLAEGLALLDQIDTP
ncbi:MAG: hypothetical protein KDI66_23415, partial [Xanthomonadales bacterium]|nr:hypothetical protein [Xanthomonadales bacterium]